MCLEQPFVLFCFATANAPLIDSNDNFMSTIWSKLAYFKYVYQSRSSVRLLAMGYEERIDCNNSVITTRIYGEVNKVDLVANLKNTLIRAKDFEYSVIHDCRKANSFLSVVDIFYWFFNSHEFIDSTLKYIPSAYIGSEENEKFFNIVETCLQKVGVITRVFKDERDAIKWFELLGPQCPVTRLLWAFRRNQKEIRIKKIVESKVIRARGNSLGS